MRPRCQVSCFLAHLASWRETAFSGAGSRRAGRPGSGADPGPWTRALASVSCGHPEPVRVTLNEPSHDSSLADRIDALLPQTQCTQCGFEGCRPYAEAIARGEADINRCPPGGDAGIAALAELLGLPPRAMDPECGEPVEQPVVAFIDESVCIGCTKCIQACPVDAIVGAAQQMHTVIASECTGCELCLPPCPVDCISLEPSPDPTPLRERAEQFRARYAARNERLERRRRERAAARAAKRPDADRAQRRAEVADAVARARARRRQRTSSR